MIYKELSSKQSPFWNGRHWEHLGRGSQDVVSRASDASVGSIAIFPPSYPLSSFCAAALSTTEPPSQWRPFKTGRNETNPGALTNKYLSNLLWLTTVHIADITNEDFMSIPEYSRICIYFHLIIVGWLGPADLYWTQLDEMLAFTGMIHVGGQRLVDTGCTWLGGLVWVVFPHLSFFMLLLSRD